MKIYPKLDEELNGVEALNQYILKSTGVEIQLLYINLDTYELNLEKSVSYLSNKYNLEELTIHMPIKFCYIEYFFSGNEEKFYKMIDNVIKLTEKYNINLNLLFHTHWKLEVHQQINDSKIKKMLKYINDTRVTILLENTVFSASKCSPILICEYYNNEKLKVCLDLCHVKCKASIFKTSINDYFEYYIPKSAYQHIKQIHFSNNKNNDGYIDKSTHSTAHELDDNFINDINLLRDYKLINCNYVVEVNENNYELREEEIKEIKNLEKIQEYLNK